MMKPKWLTRSKLWMSFLTCSAPRVMICSLAKCKTVPNPKVNPSSRVWHHLYFIQFLNGTCHSDEYNVCNCKKIWMRRSSIFVAGGGASIKNLNYQLLWSWWFGCLTHSSCTGVCDTRWASEQMLPESVYLHKDSGEMLLPHDWDGGGCYQKRRPPDESGDWVPLMWATSLWGLLWQLGDGVTERTNGVCVCVLMVLVWRRGC